MCWYSMSCLDYRCSPLLPQLLEATTRHLASLGLLLHSIASLGLGGDGPLIFDDVDGQRSHDLGNLTAALAQAPRRCTAVRGRHGRGWMCVPCGSELVQREDFSASAHDWARAAFGLVMSNDYDVEGLLVSREWPDGGHVLPHLVARACELLPSLGLWLALC
eukprot:Skav227132  [mRNA]  locus=scaffold133:203724:208920:- [translate_table: standard]